MIGQGRAESSVTLPVLFTAQGNGLVPTGKALDDALNVAQRATQSAAAAAVNKLAARLAAGSDRLAGLVRNDQNLAAEAEALGKAILAAVSKEPAKRAAAVESSRSGSGWPRSPSSARGCKVCSRSSSRTMRRCRTRSR
jgi:hypothetical protein